MSSDAFKALVHASLLRSMEVPRIEDEWLAEAQLPDNAFERLDTLACQASTECAHHLLQYASNVDDLTINAAPGACRIFSVITGAKLPYLRSLNLEPCLGSILQAMDLYRFAKDHQELEALVIPWKYEDSSTDFDDEPIVPILQGLDDAMLESIVQFLPCISNLSLISDSQGLTEQTLISLANHCPRLRYCKLAATVDFENLVNCAPRPMWNQLWQLVIIEPLEAGAEERARVRYTEEGSVQDVARLLCQMMPNLTLLDFRDDWALQQEVREMSR